MYLFYTTEWLRFGGPGNHFAVQHLNKTELSLPQNSIRTDLIIIVTKKTASHPNSFSESDSGASYLESLITFDKCVMTK